MGSKPDAITMYSRSHQSIASVSSLAKWELIKSTYFVGLHEEIRDTLNVVYDPCKNLQMKTAVMVMLTRKAKVMIRNNLERQPCNRMSPCSATLRVRKFFNVCFLL